jgi:hypothetical protein
MAERRSLFQSSRGIGAHPFAATGAAAAEQAHLGHIRADWRQFDAFVDLLRGLRCVGEHRLALGAGGQPSVDRAVRVRMQRAADAGAAFARRAICGGGWEVLLLSL